MGEHWVCDGKSVFEFNHKAKQLIETTLPPELRGKAIADGPLPFMFGAKAESIKNRYWIRQLEREGEQAPWRLEFVPKFRGADYSRIRLSLDAARFLPTENGAVRSERCFRWAIGLRLSKAAAEQCCGQTSNSSLAGLSVHGLREAGRKCVHNVNSPAPQQTPGAGTVRAEAVKVRPFKTCC